MPHYIAVIDHADDMFGAYFPDALGCTAQGATEDEVIGNAADALAEWVRDELADGRSRPEPRTYLQILKAGQDDLGKGGMIARIPLILNTGKLARANISLDEGLLANIDEAAQRIGVTRSAFLAAAATEKIKAIA